MKYYFYIDETGDYLKSKELNTDFEVIKGKFYQNNWKVYGFKVHP